MMKTILMDPASDMDLVARSLSGNRDAFGQIVSRYQNLICSLAYSATGNLSQSEDLAQETFFTAWKQLGDLREPPKLRSWLCGIARNLINNTLRRQGREPVHHADELDAAQEAAAPERLPVEHAISNEEQAILWRALERIPAIYREPLVLFYREHQSIEAVAQQLELSEDAVKQRLSRGRKLLQEEVAAFVEGALRQSAPGRAFAGMVLAALPASPAGLAAAGVGAGAAKTGGIFSVLAMQVVSFLAPMLGSLWFVRSQKNPTMRRALRDMLVTTWLSVAVVMVAQCTAGILHHELHWRPQTYYLVEAGNFWMFIMLLLTWQAVFFNQHRKIQAQEASSDAPNQKPYSGWGGFLAWCSMMVGGLGWLVNTAWQAGDMLAFGISLTVTVAAIAWPLCVSAVIGEPRFKKSGLAFVSVLLMYGVILLMLNWRLDLWIARGAETDLTGAHALLPMWTVHVGTLLILAWVGTLLVATKPKRQL